MRPWMVVGKLKVFILEIEEIFDFRVQVHLWQRTRLTGELQFRLINMVEIKMGITGRVDEVPCFQASYLCHHQQQQSIGSNVEGHSQESVGTALIKLQAQASIGNIKLKQAMTGGNAIWSTSAGFHAVTIILLEFGLFLMVSMTFLIWSMAPPFPSGQARHW